MGRTPVDGLLGHILLEQPLGLVQLGLSRVPLADVVVILSSDGPSGAERSPYVLPGRGNLAVFHTHLARGMAAQLDEGVALQDRPWNRTWVALGEGLASHNE